MLTGPIDWDNYKFPLTTGAGAPLSPPVIGGPEAAAAGPPGLRSQGSSWFARWRGVSSRVLGLLGCALLVGGILAPAFLRLEVPQPEDKMPLSYWFQYRASALILGGIAAVSLLLALTQLSRGLFWLLSLVALGWTAATLRDGWDYVHMMNQLSRPTAGQLVFLGSSWLLLLSGAGVNLLASLLQAPRSD